MQSKTAEIKQILIANLRSLSIKVWIGICIILLIIFQIILHIQRSEISRSKYLEIEHTKPHSVEETTFLKQALVDGEISLAEEREFQKLHDEAIKQRLLQP